MSGLIVDLFAGGGGASRGIEAAGHRVDIAVNHDPVAIEVHRANHPETLHFVESVWKVKPLEATAGRPVDLLWASPDCRSFSRAKGGKPRDKKIRILPWAVVRWARDVRPRIICLENVKEFRDWGPLDENNEPVTEKKGQSFQRWLGKLKSHGYEVEYRVLNAAHYGAPTSRERLFLIARCDKRPIRWPVPTHGEMGKPPMRTAAECIDWSLPCPSIFEPGRGLAKNTLRRVAEGLKRFVLHTSCPFVVSIGEEPAVPALIQMGYGEREGQRPRALNLHAPLGTIVAEGVKHGLVAAFLSKHYKGVIGQPLTRPIGTITATDHHSISTVTFGERGKKVRRFLEKHGLNPDCPIADIGLRMLAPHELLRAQFGKYASTYDLSPATTQEAKVRLVGNSVCPEVAEALIRANLPQPQHLAEAAE
jgi:DNA (cytosine-5)-methyltransferase 1